MANVEKLNPVQSRIKGSMEDSILLKGEVDWVAVFKGCMSSNSKKGPLGVMIMLEKKDRLATQDDGAFLALNQGFGSYRITAGAVAGSGEITCHLPKAFFSKTALDNLYASLIHIPSEIRSDDARSLMIHQDKKAYTQARVLTPTNLIWTLCQISMYTDGMSALMAAANGETAVCYGDDFRLADSVAVSNYQNRLMMYSAMFGGLSRTMVKMALTGVQWLKRFTLTGENADSGQWFKMPVDQMWARHATDTNGMVDLSTIISPEAAKKLAVRISKLYANTSAPSIGKWNFFVLDLDDNASDTIKSLFNVGTVYPTRSEFCRIGVSRLTSPDFLIKTVIAGRPDYFDVKASNGYELADYAIAATSSVKSGGATIANCLLETAGCTKEEIHEVGQNVTYLKSVLEDYRVTAVFFVRGVRHQVSGWLIDGREMRATNLYSTYGLKALNQEVEVTEETLEDEELVDIEADFGTTSASGACQEGLLLDPEFPVIETVRKMILTKVVGHSFKLGHLTQQDFHNMTQDLGWDTTKKFMDIVWSDSNNFKTVASFAFLQRYNSGDKSNVLYFGKDLLDEINRIAFDGQPISPNNCNLYQANIMFGGKTISLMNGTKAVPSPAVGVLAAKGWECDKDGNVVTEGISFPGFLNSTKDIVITVEQDDKWYDFVFPNKDLAQGWAREGNSDRDGVVVLSKGAKLFMSLLTSFRNPKTDWKRAALNHEIGTQEYVFGKRSGEVKVNAKTYVLLPAWWATEHHHVYMSSMKGTREALYGKLPVLFTHGNTKVLVHGKDHFPAELNWMFDPLQNGNGNAEFGNREAIYVHPYLLLAQQNDADGDGARICFLSKEALDLVPFYKDQDPMYSAWHQKYITGELDLAVKVKAENTIKDCSATRDYVVGQYKLNQPKSDTAVDSKNLIGDIRKFAKLAIKIAQDIALVDDNDKNKFCVATMTNNGYSPETVTSAFGDLIDPNYTWLFMLDVAMVFGGGFMDTYSDNPNVDYSGQFKLLQNHWDKITRATENLDKVGAEQVKAEVVEDSAFVENADDGLTPAPKGKKEDPYALKSVVRIDELFQVILRLTGYISPVIDAAVAACKAKRDVAIMSAFLYKIEQACQYLINTAYGQHEELLRRFQQIITFVIQDEAMRQAKHTDKAAGLLQFIGTAQWNEIRKYKGATIDHFMDGFWNMFVSYCQGNENIAHITKIFSYGEGSGVLQMLMETVVDSNYSVKLKGYKAMDSEYRGKKTGKKYYIGFRPLLDENARCPLYAQNAIFSNGCYTSLREVIDTAVVYSDYENGEPVIKVKHPDNGTVINAHLSGNGSDQKVAYDKGHMHEVEFIEFLSRTIFIRDGFARDSLLELKGINGNKGRKPLTMNELIILKNLNGLPQEQAIANEIKSLEQNLIDLEDKKAEIDLELEEKLAKLNNEEPALVANINRNLHEAIDPMLAELAPLEEELIVAQNMVKGYTEEKDPLIPLLHELASKTDKENRKKYSKEEKEALFAEKLAVQTNINELHECIREWSKIIKEVVEIDGVEKAIGLGPEVKRLKKKIEKTEQHWADRLEELALGVVADVETKTNKATIKAEKRTAKVERNIIYTNALLMKLKAKTEPRDNFTSALAKGEADPSSLEINKEHKKKVYEAFLNYMANAEIQLTEEDGMPTMESQAVHFDYSEEEISRYSNDRDEDYDVGQHDYEVPEYENVPTWYEDLDIPSVEPVGLMEDITGDIPSDISDTEEVEDDLSDEDLGLDF